ncbi:MAG: homoserine kinase [Geminicoccaceae bacterium]|nr:homoserine kinase [Geminicoccaceae bacterium]
MAVYTAIDEDQLGALLATFDLGEVLALKGIAEGVENSNYFLLTERGRYILTIYEKRVDAADLPFFLGLMDHLSGRGFVCPVPVKDRLGRTLHRLAGKPAAIVSFLDGQSPRALTPQRCRALGRALAALHGAGAGFVPVRPNALSVAAWRPLFEQARRSGMEDGLEEEISADLDHVERAWPEGLPAGVIHADLFPDNAFFDHDEVSGVIDFYFACNDLLAYDLAICLNAWCFEASGEFNVTKSRALIEGYAAERRLEPAEVAALPVLARGAALRFLLTRLYDWLNRVEGALVSPKDPNEYLRKLRFHRAAGGPQAYGI